VELQTASLSRIDLFCAAPERFQMQIFLAVFGMVQLFVLRVRTFARPQLALTHIVPLAQPAQLVLEVQLHQQFVHLDSTLFQMLA